MTTSVKKTVVRFAWQLAVSFIEYEVRTKLKEKGIDPDEFEQVLRNVLNSQKSKAANSIGSGKVITEDFALRELGLSPDASPAEIKSTFKKLVLKYHSDRTKDPTTEVKLRAVIEAYNFLKDSGRAS